MNPGDVYWVDFPAGAGRAQAGRRPAVIAQSSYASAGLPTVLLFPLTTQQDALRFPGVVSIEANAENGLRRASVVLVFQLTVLDKRFLGSHLGRISETDMQAVWSALDEITGRKEMKSGSQSEG